MIGWEVRILADNEQQDDYLSNMPVSYTHLFKPESVSSQFNFSKLSVFGDLFFKAPFAMAVIDVYKRQIMM